MDKSKALVRIVDDDQTIRDSVGFLLEYEGYRVQCWESAEQYLREDRPSIPGCLILDIKMPGMSGVELQKLLLNRDERPPIIFLTAHGDVEIAVESMKDGAVDFLQKPLKPAKFLRIVERAIQRDFEMKTFGGDFQSLHSSWLTLTDREREIAKLTANGLSSREIADSIGLSKRTVDNHRASIYKKLRINSLEQLEKFLSASHKCGS